MTKQLRSFSVQSKWTHTSGACGWKHFRIVTIRKGEDGKEFEMMAVCDKSVRFWVSMEDLKLEHEWKMGWL